MDFIREQRQQEARYHGTLNVFYTDAALLLSQGSLKPVWRLITEQSPTAQRAKEAAITHVRRLHTNAQDADLPSQ